VVLIEMPDSRLSRRDRQALEEAIDRLSQSLPGLSRMQRDKTVRLATDAMESASS
jgi:RNA polymerase-interacting CarD/CdnL/TRCF family regulator